MFIFRFLWLLCCVDYKEAKVEERPVWRLFQLSLQKIIIIRIGVIAVEVMRSGQIVDLQYFEGWAKNFLMH